MEEGRRGGGVRERRGGREEETKGGGDEESRGEKRREKEPGGRGRREIEIKIIFFDFGRRTAKSCFMASTTVTVFPVPGGPQMIKGNLSPSEGGKRICPTARFCSRFSVWLNHAENFTSHPGTGGGRGGLKRNEVPTVSTAWCIRRSGVREKVNRTSNLRSELNLA